MTGEASEDVKAFRHKRLHCMPVVLQPMKKFRMRTLQHVDRSPVQFGATTVSTGNGECMAMGVDFGTLVDRRLVGESSTTPFPRIRNHVWQFP